MRKSITISLPESIEREVDSLMHEEGVTRSDIIRESLSEYLYFKRLRKTREELLLNAQSKGIFTDDDVFERA